MDFVLRDILQLISTSSNRDVVNILKRESSRLEITKSLLNVLHNFTVLRNIPLTNRQKREFAPYTSKVQKLLCDNSLKIKKNTLQKNPELAKLIAQVCPKRRASFS